MNKKSLFVFTALLFNASSAHSSISSITVPAHLADLLIKSEIVLLNVASVFLVSVIIGDTIRSVRNYFANKAYEAANLKKQQNKYAEQMKLNKEISLAKAKAA